MVTVDVFHPHHHRVGILPVSYWLLRQNDGAVTDVQLRAVVRNSKTQGETEGVAKPVDSLTDIRISKHGNDRAPRLRALRKHVLSTFLSALC